MNETDKRMDDIEARRVLAYTDGSCIGNPGPGGWAAIMVQGEKRRVLKGGDPDTTNNRMEITAAIEAVASMLTDAPLTIFSDSQWVVNGYNTWLPNWKRKGWKNSDRKPVKNQDLWKRLDELVSARPHGVSFVWTRGHAGTPLNEEADHLANEEAAKAARRAAVAA